MIRWMGDGEPYCVASDVSRGPSCGEVCSSVLVGGYWRVIILRHSIHPEPCIYWQMLKYDLTTGGGGCRNQTYDNTGLECY